MTNLKASGLAALTSILLASASYASDLNGGVKDGPNDTFSPKVVNWTGIYVGAQVGHQNSNHKMSVEQQGYLPSGCKNADAVDDGSSADGQCKTPQLQTANDGSKSCTNGGTVNSGGTGCEAPVQQYAWKSFTGAISAFVDGLNSSGVFGGGTVGADIQRGNLLFGVFGDYNLGSGSHDVGLEAANIIGVTAKTIEDGDSWVIAARAGVLLGQEKRALLYGLAGYGQQDVTYNGIGGSHDVTHSGWVVGAGGEYALTQNLFIGLEYQHFFGDEETIGSLQASGPARPYDSRLQFKDEVDTDKVMAKLKLKLNGERAGLGW